MKRALVGLFLAAFAAVVFRAEMSTAGYLLRLSILRQGLLNHELASSLLERRLWAIQSDDALNAELRNFVAESTVFAAGRPEIRATLEERIGIPVVNAVRLLGLKPLLGIDADRIRLEEMQSAFLLERAKRVKEAEEIYAGLAGGFSRGSEDRAFILLHRSYCLLLLGRTDEAQAEAHRLIDEQPGTHYARSAAVLLEFLNRQQELVRIAGRSTDNAQRGRYYFLGGAFGRSAEEYSRAQRLAVDDRLRYARALEETGQVQVATRLLEEVARDPSPAARSANERLLLIGHFLGGGEEVRQAAVERAERLGQNDLIARVETAVVLQAPVRSVVDPATVNPGKDANPGTTGRKGREEVKEQNAELDRIRSSLLARPRAAQQTPRVFEIQPKIVPEGTARVDAVIVREKAALANTEEKPTAWKTTGQRSGPEKTVPENGAGKSNGDKKETKESSEKVKSTPERDHTKGETSIPVAGAGLIVELMDDRKIYADEVQLKTDAAVLILRGAEIEIPVQKIRAISPGSGFLQIEPKIGRRAERIDVRDGRFRAVTGSSLFPLRGTESIRAAQK